LLLLKVLRACRSFRPDIIHAHLHEGIVIGKIASLLFRIPLVADLQGSLTDELLAHKFLPNSKAIVKLVSWIERKINQMPAHLIVSSTHTAQACVKLYGVAADRVTSVMDGVDLDIYRPLERDISLQTSLGIIRMKGENES
jgi:glycosyltransferase involved in cell wall biosynthesis